MPADTVNSATMMDWLHKQPWGWYAAGVTIVAAAVCAFNAFESVTMFTGRIQDETSNGVHPHVANVHVILIPEDEAKAFISKCNDDMRAEEARLVADLSNGFAHAKLAAPANLATTKNVELSASDPMQITEELQKARWRFNRFPVAGFFFRRLPEPKAVASMVTDNQGAFAAMVPRNQRFLLAAQTYTDRAASAPPPTGAERRLQFHPPDKNCYWLLWVTPGKGKVCVLNAGNMIDHKTTDNCLTASLYDYWER